MNEGNSDLRRKGRASSRAGMLAGIALAGILALALGTLRAQEKAQKDTGKDKEVSLTMQGAGTDAGLIVSARATAKDLGLSIYPGAIPHVDKGKEKDSPAAKLGLWANSFGFKLVVLKMESKDPPSKVAEYYQKELADYGTVLDCTNATSTPENKEGKSGKLTCSDDKPDNGGILFKVGTEHRQRLVGVQPDGSGTVFQLVYVEVRGEQKEPD